MMSERMSASRSQNKALISQINSQDNAELGQFNREKRNSKTYKKEQTALRLEQRQGFGNKDGADVRDTRFQDDNDRFRQHNEEEYDNKKWLQFIEETFNDNGYVVGGGGFKARRQGVKFH